MDILREKTLMVALIGAGLMAASALGIMSAGPQEPDDILLVGPREPIVEEIVATQQAFEEIQPEDAAPLIVSPEPTVPPIAVDAGGPAAVVTVDSGAFGSPNPAPPQPSDDDDDDGSGDDDAAGGSGDDDAGGSGDDDAGD